ncbi:hypothetical protein G6F57_023694 [Rhizopus arrhizus]|nr:hypothetical protein G6F57_023694 [Rhizopus arrhizus]
MSGGALSNAPSSPVRYNLHFPRNTAHARCPVRFLRRPGRRPCRCRCGPARTRPRRGAHPYRAGLDPQPRPADRAWPVWLHADPAGPRW